MHPSVKSPLWAAAACFLGFAAVLACAYGIAPVERLDARAFHWMRALDGGPPSSPIILRITHSADPRPLLLVLAGLFACGWALGRRWEAIGAIALVAGANLTALILQVALAHPRYHSFLGANQLGAEAFPSGHATGAASIALAAVLVAPPRLRIPVGVGAGAYVIAVSASLMMLGWHFGSDVLGGVLVSCGFFFLAVAAIRVGTAAPAGIAANRATLGLWLGLAGAFVAALATAGLIAREELLEFARLHTGATAAALAIMAISAALVASTTLKSDLSSDR
jgi:membrane-associated phospholipid phosphatase